MDIFGRVAEERRWKSANDIRTPSPGQSTESITPAGSKEKERTEWNRIMESSNGSSANFMEVVDEGLEYLLVSLELKRPLKRSKGTKTAYGDDVESNGETARPNGSGVASHLQQMTDQFCRHKVRRM